MFSKGYAYVEVEKKGALHSVSDINAGDEWEKEVQLHLTTAPVILLLISPDFLASDYCYSVEMKHALERHEQGEVHVIPIILRISDWRRTPLNRLQALPKDAHPITRWNDRDEAFHDVSERLFASDLRGFLEDCFFKFYTTFPSQFSFI